MRRKRPISSIPSLTIPTKSNYNIFLGKALKINAIAQDNTRSRVYYISNGAILIQKEMWLFQVL